MIIILMACQFRGLPSKSYMWCQAVSSNIWLNSSCNCCPMASSNTSTQGTTSITTSEQSSSQSTPTRHSYMHISSSLQYHNWSTYSDCGFHGHWVGVDMLDHEEKDKVIYYHKKVCLCICMHMHGGGWRLTTGILRQALLVPWRVAGTLSLYWVVQGVVMTEAPLPSCIKQARLYIYKQLQCWCTCSIWDHCQRFFSLKSNVKVSLSHTQGSEHSAIWKQYM